MNYSRAHIPHRAYRGGLIWLQVLSPPYTFAVTHFQGSAEEVCENVPAPFRYNNPPSRHALLIPCRTRLYSRQSPSPTTLMRFVLFTKAVPSFCRVGALRSPLSSLYAVIISAFYDLDSQAKSRSGSRSFPPDRNIARNVITCVAYARRPTEGRRATDRSEPPR